MRNFRRAAMCGVISAFATGAALAQQAAAPRIAQMALTSASFEDGGVLPVKYAAISAKPVSPPLSWSGEPASTVSFALISHDMEADPLPTISHWHWGRVNIPASVHALDEAQPEVAQPGDGSIQYINAHNTFGWASPAASGPTYHHYAFEIYALDTKLALGPNASQDDVYKAMQGHIVGKGVTVSRYTASKVAK